MRKNRKTRTLVAAAVLTPVLALTGGIAYAAGGDGDHHAPPSTTSTQTTTPTTHTRHTDPGHRDDCRHYGTRTATNTRAGSGHHHGMGGHTDRDDAAHRWGDDHDHDD